MFKILIVIAVLVTSNAYAACGSAQSTRPLDQIATDTEKLLFKRDFAALDQLVTAYRRPDSYAADGQANLTGMYEGLSKSRAPCAGLHESDARWLQRRALLVEWSKVAREPTAPLLALANFEFAYGWHARGAGYSATVTPEGNALLQERVETARQQLEAMPPTARLDPDWYALMLDVGISQGWSAGKFDAMFNKAVQQFPEFVDYYLLKARFYSPKWYGSTQQLVTLMNQASQGPSHIARGLYARLYRYVDRAGGADMNNGTVSYPKLKNSYEALLREFPSDWLRNPYARYACIAGDWPVVRTQLQLIGEHTTSEVWNREFYQYCQAMVAQTFPPK